MAFAALGESKARRSILAAWTRHFLIQALYAVGPETPVFYLGTLACDVVIAATTSQRWPSQLLRLATIAWVPHRRNLFSFVASAALWRDSLTNSLSSGHKPSRSSQNHASPKRALS